MLKTQCRLAFLRSYVPWKCLKTPFSKNTKTCSCYRPQTGKYGIGGGVLSNYSTQGWKIRPCIVNHQLQCRYLVQCTKEAISSTETFTKPSSSLNIGLNTSVEQSDIVQDKSDVPSQLSWNEKLQYYLRLSKIRLTGLVVLTTMAGYSLAPGEFSATTCALVSIGTMLCSCSANTINQWLEVPFDSQMSRTKNRVLVRGLMSSSHALTFGILAGASGLTMLLTQVNGLTALLGASTLILYTTVYTPLKRLSIANTWVGSVVGALPPLMGWTACTGTLDPGALILGGILYSWQFPHFNALSWNLRADYSRAGYRMMSVLNPDLCRKVALRHCVSLVVFSTLLPVCDVTTWWLALDSLPVNLWLIWLASKFQKRSDNKSARELFRFSLLHLPLLMFLILFHKRSKESEAVPEEKTLEGHIAQHQTDKNSGN
ncbi:protoheme IX farnesyltransferase, mitochondrial-like [Dendronephthya gigantea]|uniref:protoheme IX farnesyltransferase, mitochondrial-like n=1 Tax=Dendronephthya gigantea TaxID=151771 RepID=UPI00106AD25A|nr:protoheme IX farnesyltransferase, mitochondrial-like [Dendronephthya gigantea]XP_028418629.1 protoheme IX farnesyltransferase, mitochondrial-like [Dendronephthya gigantea]